jgi:hypothetical protein
MRPGDWVCPRLDCHYQNFAMRSVCIKCTEPRSTGSSDIDKDVNDDVAAVGDCDRWDKEMTETNHDATRRLGMPTTGFSLAKLRYAIRV